MAPASVILPRMAVPVRRALGALLRTVRAFSLPPIYIDSGHLALPKIRLGEERVTWLRWPPPAEAGLWLSHLTLAPRHYRYSFHAAVDAAAVDALRSVIDQLLEGRERTPLQVGASCSALWPDVNGYPFTIEGRVPAILDPKEGTAGDLVLTICTADPDAKEKVSWRDRVAECLVDVRVEANLSLWGDPEVLSDLYPLRPEWLPGPLLLVLLEEDMLFRHAATLPAFNQAMECLAWAWVMRQADRGFYE